MQTIIAGLGFILGVIIFVILMKNLNFIFTSFYSLVFLFIISLIVGMILAKILGWLIIIFLVIGVILLIIFWRKDDDKQNAEDEVNCDEEKK